MGHGSDGPNANDLGELARSSDADATEAFPNFEIKIDALADDLSAALLDDDMTDHDAHTAPIVARRGRARSGVVRSRQRAIPIPRITIPAGHTGQWHGQGPASSSASARAGAGAGSTWSYSPSALVPSPTYPRSHSPNANAAAADGGGGGGGWLSPSTPTRPRGSSIPGLGGSDWAGVRRGPQSAASAHSAASGSSAGSKRRHEGASDEEGHDDNGVEDGRGDGCMGGSEPMRGSSSPRLRKRQTLPVSTSNENVQDAASSG